MADGLGVRLERGENEKLGRCTTKVLEVKGMFIVLIMVMISQVHYVSKIIILYTMNTCSLFCHLYLNKAVKIL